MAKSTKKQPAAEQPAATDTKAQGAKAQGGVGIRELAEHLGVSSEKSLRSRIRRVNGGPMVGRGGRYHWESLKDPELVALIEKLNAPKAAKADATA